MAAVLLPLGLAVHLAQAYQAARQAVPHLEVHSVQAQLVEDLLAQDQFLQDQHRQYHLVELELVDPLVNQMQEESLILAPITPLHHQCSPSV